MFELGDAKLELLVFLAQDEAELAQRALEPGARSLADADGVAAPARDEVADEGARLVAPHAAALGELVRERVRLLRGQRDGTHRRKGELLRDLQNTLIWLGHADALAAAAAAARASRHATPRSAGRPPARA